MDEHVKQPDKAYEVPVRQQVATTDTFTIPAADVFETAEDIVVCIKMPGVGSEDIDIELRDQMLTVTAEQKGDEKDASSSRGYFRQVSLSERVDEERITATFDSGMLRLVLPKTKRSVRRTIEIKTR